MQFVFCLKKKNQMLKIVYCYKEFPCAHILRHSSYKAVVLMVTSDISALSFQRVWSDVSWLKRVTHSSGLMCQCVTCTFSKIGTQSAPFPKKPEISDWLQPKLWERSDVLAPLQEFTRGVSVRSFFLAGKPEGERAVTRFIVCGNAVKRKLNKFCLHKMENDLLLHSIYKKSPSKNISH